MFELRFILEECILKKFFGRNTIKRSDVFVIFLTLLLIFSTFLAFRPKSEEGRVAVITVDGKTEMQMDLNLQDDCIFTLETNPVVTLQVKDGKIRFTDSKCPDSTCEKAGFLSKVGDTAACVPAKAVVTVKGNNTSGIDAVAG